MAHNFIVSCHRCFRRSQWIREAFRVPKRFGHSRICPLGLSLNSHIKHFWAVAHSTSICRGLGSATGYVNSEQVVSMNPWKNHTDLHILLQKWILLDGFTRYLAQVCFYVILCPQSPINSLCCWNTVPCVSEGNSFWAIPCAFNWWERNMLFPKSISYWFTSLYHLIYRSDLDFSPHPDLPLTSRNRPLWGQCESHPIKVFKRKLPSSLTPEFT